ncbi:hypothetical protein AXF42_Ash021444 [Apostasia shenzhenica]|uniref:Uncharacterized protein n=1 Tax=Apostasia shenzhenica TaxID=1088818 RepID=A0A2H9ZUE4_9ASPA|nr:hypothetical protein AXF42_Ash021444 [Apostasia shenzhenica]
MVERSKAEKAIVELESKYAHYECDLEAITLENEGLKKERAAFMARVEELEEENYLLAKPDYGLSS